MDELIKVTVKNDQQLVSARELHKGLKLKKHFGDWVKQNFKDFYENEDYTCAPRSAYVQIGNGATRKVDDYALTLDMAKQLCMMSHTELGRKYRKYFIELERKWNDPQEVVKRGYAILQNENTQLKLENEQMKPKALFADAVSVSKTTILVSELAKILKQNGVNIGATRLFAWMRENGYLISRKGTDWNMPTQRSMELGLFNIKETTITHSDGHTTISKTTKVTGKGQQYFINKFLKDIA
ncbi:phage antirepressor KilAC domain-containing protein [Ligilactobacillus murinus]|uniref:phage antirepressor KilAC domain-containing protein n=1 Tax=Ligilactobacillus murinus TaxID=1622 RepID=UPI00214C3FA9|nr:phage antirepressor KilAC domain-containing protein [Ligilactobacillus murinus]MCR1896446.1 phage antirepressor KilAC domain-containing protein [Ligilactobacillus murinus]MDE7023386.1 phage antirepressor KilAC domain-containing protein [Ligilactobacillus sp.]MDO4456979.1 phage antirepressor KilAC domain-containing protein [Ligilactobacillus murinus]